MASDGGSCRQAVLRLVSVPLSDYEILDRARVGLVLDFAGWYGPVIRIGLYFLPQHRALCASAPATLCGPGVICDLSKGTVQRVALAHTMVVQPRLLVLDEPLSGLDPVGRKDVVDILNEYKQQGGAIFFTSHVLHDVERIADRFGFINKGELLTVRSPRELAAERADQMLVRFNAAHSIEAGARQLREG